MKLFHIIYLLLDAIIKFLNPRVFYSHMPDTAYDWMLIWSSQMSIGRKWKEILNVTEKITYSFHVISFTPVVFFFSKQCTLSFFLYHLTVYCRMIPKGIDQQVKVVDIVCEVPALCCCAFLFSALWKTRKPSTLLLHVNLQYFAYWVYLERYCVFDWFYIMVNLEGNFFVDYYWVLCWIRK